jgi:hypothetical protein
LDLDLDWIWIRNGIQPKMPGPDPYQMNTYSSEILSTAMLFVLQMIRTISW